MSNKCIVCKKRKLTNMVCRCGKTTCIVHRNAESHNCQYDYNKNGKKQLEKQNPTVTNKKVENI